MSKRVILLLTLVLGNFLPALTQAGPTATPTIEEEVAEPKDLKPSGVYEDLYCGFQITIPRALVGIGNAPFGHHGIFIPFCKEKVCGGIEIYTGFNSTETVSPGEDAGGMVKINKENTDISDWELLSQGPTKFNGLPAYRVKYRYTVRKTGAKMKCIDLFFLTSLDDKGNPVAPPQSEKQMKKDFMDAFDDKTQRDKRPTPSHAWMLTLTAEETGFADKEKLYDAVLSGFKLFKPTEVE